MVLRLVHQQGRRANGHAGPIELTGQPSQQARSTHVPLPYRLGTGLHHLYHTLIHDDRPAQNNCIQLLQSEYCWQYLLNYKDRRCHPNQALHPKYLTSVHNKHNAAEFQPGAPDNHQRVATVTSRQNPVRNNSRQGTQNDIYSTKSGHSSRTDLCVHVHVGQFLELVGRSGIEFWGQTICVRWCSRCRRLPQAADGHRPGTSLGEDVTTALMAK